MKFNCGLTPYTRFVNEEEAARKYREETSKWHRYFLWWPKQMGNYDCRWLEWIERKGTWTHEFHYAGRPLNKGFGRLIVSWTFRLPSSQTSSDS